MSPEVNEEVSIPFPDILKIFREFKVLRVAFSIGPKRCSSGSPQLGGFLKFWRNL